MTAAGGPFGTRGRLKRAAAATARALGVDTLARRANARRLLVVCYHGVRTDDAPDRHWLLVPQREFGRQIRYLADRYRCVSLDEGVAELRAGGPRAPTACVTLDDGYLNHRTVALPVLEHYRVPAVMYLPTALIDRGELPWAPRLELAFRDSRAPEIDLASLGLGRRRLSDEASRAAAGRAAVVALASLPDAPASACLAELLATLGESAAARGASWRMMTWDDVRAVASRGLVTFGAHTVEHRLLSRLGDADVEREVAESVRAVAAATSAVSRTFAYPHGRPIDFDARARSAVRRAGCVAAVSTIAGLNDGEVDPYALRRLSVGQHMSLGEFALRAAGAVRAAATTEAPPAGRARGPAAPASS